jgi:phytoene dehydrogenase-like protein
LIEEIRLQAHAQDIIVSPSKGVMTHSQKLVSFVEHHLFISCIEPKNVEEALQDPDWVNDMHEELNNFTCNEVWTLEERPQDARIIGTK